MYLTLLWTGKKKAACSPISSVKWALDLKSVLVNVIFVSASYGCVCDFADNPEQKVPIWYFGWTNIHQETQLFSALYFML
jgi:hypothetical protein